MTSQKSGPSISFNFYNPGHTKTSQKSDASIFSNFHDFSQKSEASISWPRVNKISKKSETSIFSNFHDPGYTKLHKSQMLYFSSIFMIPGTQNFTKIRCFNFLQFPCLGYTKSHKNLTLQFSPIFVTPGTQNYTKIWRFNFLQFSWPPGYMNFHKNQKLQFLWPLVNKISKKSEPSIFSNFHQCLNIANRNSCKFWLSLSHHLLCPFWLLRRGAKVLIFLKPKLKLWSDTDSNIYLPNILP